MTITVAICTRGRYQGVAKAIGSLSRRLRSDPDVRIMIVDNAPEDIAVLGKLLRTRDLDWDNLQIVTEPSLGVSNARNAALASCSSDLLAFLDDDCIASEGWLDKLVESYKSAGAHVGAVGGKVTGLWHGDRPAWLSYGLFSYLSLLDLGDKRMDISYPQYLVGGNIIYCVEALKSIGGFKTYLGRIGDVLLSNEEVEVCWSLRAKGYRLVYEPDATVLHDIPGSRLTQDWFRRRVFWQVISDELMNAAGPTPREELRSAEQFTTSMQMGSLESASETDDERAFRLQCRNLKRILRTIASGRNIPGKRTRLPRFQPDS